MKTMYSYLPAGVQSAEKLTAGLKGETEKQEVKFRVAENFKRWMGYDETKGMNGWHWVLGTDHSQSRTLCRSHGQQLRAAHFLCGVEFTPWKHWNSGHFSVKGPQVWSGFSRITTQKWCKWQSSKSDVCLFSCSLTWIFVLNRRHYKLWKS